MDEIFKLLIVFNVKHFLDSRPKESGKPNSENQGWVVAPCLNGINGLARNAEDCAEGCLRKPGGLSSVSNLGFHVTSMLYASAECQAGLS